MSSLPCYQRSPIARAGHQSRDLHPCQCFYRSHASSQRVSDGTHPQWQQLRSTARRAPSSLRARRKDPVIAPVIVTGRGQEQEAFDLYEYLLGQRIIFIGEYINDKVATKVVASLMALEQIDENAEIRVYLNTPGGQPYSVFGLVDAIKSVKPPVSTVGLGTAYSYCSILLGAGSKGRRFATKNCRIMMTMPMGGSEGSHFGIERTVQELNALYQMQLCYFKKFTNLSFQTLEDLTVRDTFLTPEEAQDIGLVDHIISGPADYFVPPAKVRQQILAGLEPPYNPGIGSAGVEGWTGRMG